MTQQAYEYQLVVCIVNSGFSDAVMDAARDAGAGGGTILAGRGTANKEAERFFGITVQPEKDMVMIVVPTAIKDAVMHALYKAVGLNTPGQGIAFALPVECAVGMVSGAAPVADEENKRKSRGKKAEEQSSKIKTAVENTASAVKTEVEQAQSRSAVAVDNAAEAKKNKKDTNADQGDTVS